MLICRSSFRLTGFGGLFSWRAGNSESLVVLPATTSANGFFIVKFGTPLPKVIAELFADCSSGCFLEFSSFAVLTSDVTWAGMDFTSLEATCGVWEFTLDVREEDLMVAWELFFTCPLPRDIVHFKRYLSFEQNPAWSNPFVDL
jgi:hypothetical protein